jgi:hypothetical protein
MTLRWKLMLALVGASLLGVLVSFGVMAVLPDLPLAVMLAVVLSAGLAAALGYGFANSIARALNDLQLVIHRFIKWDMDGLVPHECRATRSAPSPRR